MLGNAAEAREALAGTLRYLGAGSWRTAYANATDTVVYKVTNVKQDDFMNEFEFANAFVLSEMEGVPEFVSIPEVSIHYVSGRAVVAMPFIDGVPWGLGSSKKYDFGKKMWDWFYEVGMRDMGGDNIRVTPDGIAHIVDMGFRWTRV
jgi:hypothetical protein